MDPVSATPAHALMQAKQREDRHGPGEGSVGAASAFATYAFGPMQLPDANRSEPAKAPPPAENPMKAPSMAWVTTVQGLDTGTKA